MILFRILQQVFRTTTILLSLILNLNVRWYLRGMSNGSGVFGWGVVEGFARFGGFAGKGVALLLMIGEGELGLDSSYIY